MDRQTLFDLQTLTFARCAQILHSKNKDYAGVHQDALRNFKMVQQLGVTSPAQGVLVRLTDKLMRIINVLSAGSAAVRDETVEDTIDDAINYLIILKSIIQDEHGARPCETKVPDEHADTGHVSCVSDGGETRAAVPERV